MSLSDALRDAAMNRPQYPEPGIGAVAGAGIAAAVDQRKEWAAVVPSPSPEARRVAQLADEVEFLRRLVEKLTAALHESCRLAP